MKPIKIQTVEHDGHTYRLSIFHDPDVPNPLKDWSQIGTILRHFMQWCKGEVYGYEVERVRACGRWEIAELLKSRWSCYGQDSCLSEARAAFEAQMKRGDDYEPDLMHALAAFSQANP